MYLTQVPLNTVPLWISVEYVNNSHYFNKHNSYFRLSSGVASKIQKMKGKDRMYPQMTSTFMAAK